VKTPTAPEFEVPDALLQLIEHHDTAFEEGTVATRIVTDKLSEIWHQPIVVEAKPAAQGNVAWDEVSRATLGKPLGGLKGIGNSLYSTIAVEEIRSRQKSAETIIRPSAT
jgi:tripartite-type tricarboxylate transporter receptor subunit TctC